MCLFFFLSLSLPPPSDLWRTLSLLCLFFLLFACVCGWVRWRERKGQRVGSIHSVSPSHIYSRALSNHSLSLSLSKPTQCGHWTVDWEGASGEKLKYATKLFRRWTLELFIQLLVRKRKRERERKRDSGGARERSRRLGGKK